LKAQDKLDFDRFMTVLGESKLDSQTTIEWQKFTQGERDVSSTENSLNFWTLEQQLLSYLPMIQIQKEHHLSTRNQI
jgi:hypothetical protein